MSKRKTVIATLIGSVAGATAIYLRDYESRERVGRAFREMYAKMTNRTADHNQANRELKIGLSSPNDFEDNEMVSEGALTSVQYYNEKQSQS